MRWLLPLALFATGCQDYGKLGEGFCTTALHRGYPICDDYENDAIDTGIWAPKVEAGTLVTERYSVERLTNKQRGHAGLVNDPGYAYRGRGVLHATLPPDVAASAQLSATAPHRPVNLDMGGDMSTEGTPLEGVRFFIWVGDSVASSTFDLVRFYDDAGVLQRAVSLDNGATRITDLSSGTTQLQGTQLFGGQWHCLEVDLYAHKVDVVADPGQNSFQAQSLSGLEAPVGFNHVEVGPTRPALLGQRAVDIWIDETIIAPAYIGCSP